jgi:hypothetical protein
VIDEKDLGILGRRLLRLPKESAAPSTYYVYVLEVKISGRLVPNVVYVGMTGTSPKERRAKHDRAFEVPGAKGGWPFSSVEYKARPGKFLQEVMDQIPKIYGPDRAHEIEGIVSRFLVKKGFLVAGDGSPHRRADIRPALRQYLK